MPRTNGHDVAAGVAAEVSLNQKTIVGRGNGVQFFDDDRLFLIRCIDTANDVWDIASYHIPTGRLNQVAALAPNALAAAGGRWFAWR